MKILSLFDWQTLLMVSIGTVIAVEFISKYITLNKRWLVFILAFIITLLRLPLDFSSVELIQNFIFNLLLNMGFAVLFYEFLGKWLIKKIFGMIKTKADAEIR